MPRNREPIRKSKLTPEQRAFERRTEAELSLLAQAEARYAEALHSASAEAQRRHALGRYRIDAAAQVAYESFVKAIDHKIGDVVSDASGVHKIGPYEEFTSIGKERWRTLVRKVIAAATGKKPA